MPQRDVERGMRRPDTRSRNQYRREPSVDDPGHHQGHLTSIQKHLVASSGEFIGTFIWLWTSYAGHLMARHQAPGEAPGGGMLHGTLVATALAYALPLLANIWAFYRISGGLFNPAITIGLAAASQLAWDRALFLVPAQLLAALAAGGLVQCMFPWDAGETNTVLAANVSIAKGVFIEMFMTSQLIFVVLMLAAEKQKATYLAPIAIGVAVFGLMICGGYYTGASLNPARSLGSAVAGLSFPGYHWIYWVGPGVGGILGAVYYRIVKLIHYEEVNPGQDHAGDTSHDGGVLPDGATLPRNLYA
ncbi:Aquaporin-1 [Colletotrichum orbiculare MAFF 240422]|uniref:Aquaporin-1 n=1 Tax=Colletotrichum orbiculare (strain 104-T / ATCC 96160 / CBS 514.97 / LARS 414 / MAFF 240422) TaxID=1213857 RepID=N4V309_COLOR|nr:Aquaporin-1 [Colletotrichum orbiculare MAFF 240422]